MFILAPAVPAIAQQPADSAPTGAGQLTPPPRSWAVDCAAQEAKLIEHPGSYLRYRMHVVDERGDHVRDQIETPEGSVARTILHDGRPLTAEEDSAERDRLTALAASPATFAHHIKNEQSNKKMGVDLLKLMPDAMLWNYAPGQPQAPAAARPRSVAEPLVALDFTPNPKWSPPNIPAETLTALEGRVWIDPHTHQLVALDGRLVRAVNVGWGMVAHLYPGGAVQLQQSQVTGDRWIVDHIDEQLVVRALMVKTIRQRLVYDSSDYHPVPPMTYQQAIKLLLDTPLPGK